MIKLTKNRGARKVSVRHPEWLAPLLGQAFPTAKPAGACMHWVPARACVLEQLDQLVEMATAVDQEYPDLDRALRLARRREQLALPGACPLTPGSARPSIPALPKAPGLAPEAGRGEFTLQELAGIQQYLDGIRAIGIRLANLDPDQVQLDVHQLQEQAYLRFIAQRGSNPNRAQA
ncbi:hypothetical protein C6383_27185 [Pseudomonas syringae pv. actinidiae]|uniref:hypothetical protein n=1 Tax=Pseudomonas syringae TaxID=317 RepID=UPI000BB5673F|nr:hypothetical protein [Pseudomonas syringae]PBK48358.1 hypothetical protein BUE61_26255 [Pseudomonas syringae pv. actinidiae]PBK52069.1 hypothetical protein BUE60_17205 [Pseudomonas syringae pv. actinidiae]RJX53955.1 hypothetical protein C6383_27185 [Pseudomonas syringae pv. actinidiae]